jgi:hypothetical protein
MSGFREHFLDKYFAYRVRYVAYVAACAPHREGWAVASEVARLSFVSLGSGLCALPFCLLTAAALQRHSLWMWVFALCAVLGMAFALAALLGALRATWLLVHRSERGYAGVNPATHSAED